MAMHMKRFGLGMRSFCTFGKIDKSIAMPTPLSLGHGIQFHEVDKQTHGKKPLAVIIGWMGAKQNQLKPYLQFYHKHGIDTMSFAVGPDHVLFPNIATSYMEKVLTTALDKAVENDEERHLIFHCFSMGGYLYGQSLRCIQGKPDKYGRAAELIKAQIFDSPPDYNSIANGIAKSIGMSGIPEIATSLFVRGYLAVTANTAGVEHRASSEIFHQNFISAPSLWYYSKADPVAKWEDCETVMGKWKALGNEVDSCMWMDSPHIQHGRKYPEQYFSKLHEFLSRHKLIQSA